MKHVHIFCRYPHFVNPLFSPNPSPWPSIKPELELGPSLPNLNQNSKTTGPKETQSAQVSQVHLRRDTTVCVSRSFLELQTIITACGRKQKPVCATLCLRCRLRPLRVRTATELCPAPTLAQTLHHKLPRINAKLAKPTLNPTKPKLIHSKTERKHTLEPSNTRTKPRPILINQNPEWRSGGRCQFRDSGFNHISGLQHIFGIRDAGCGIRASTHIFGIRDSGFGIRASNHIFGIWDSGFGTRITFSGFGIQDSGFGTGKAPSSDLGFGVRDSGLELRFRDSGFRIHVFGIRDSGLGWPHPQIRDSGFGIRDSGFGIRDSGFGIRDWEGPILRFRIRDSGFGIRDSGLGWPHPQIRDSGFGIRDSRANHILDQVLRITSQNPSQV